MHQVAKVIGSAFTDCAVWMAQMQTLRFDQKPMKSGDFDPVANCQLSNPFAFRGRNLVDRAGESKGRKLDSLVSEPGGVLKNPLKLPVAEDFVADGKFH